MNIFLSFLIFSSEFCGWGFYVQRFGWVLVGLGVGFSGSGSGNYVFCVSFDGVGMMEMKM